MITKIRELIAAGSKRKVSKIAVIAICSAAILFSGYYIARALSVLDDFSTADKVSQTWRAEVDTSAGVARLAQKTCNDAIWHCSKNNIVANTLGDGSFVVVAREETEIIKQWKEANTACDRPHCGTDGAQDGDSLKADNTINFSAYPARDACKVIGGRLPTMGELNSIYMNRAEFGTFQAVNYWSAAEFNTAFAWFVNFSTGSAANANKNTNLRVRCVLGW
jgi:hypothetical protein